MIEVTDASFDEVVLNSTFPVLVEFWAVWCKPCQAVLSLLESLEKEYQGRVLFVRVDVENNRETAQRYGIRALPTMLYLKGGKVAKLQSGSLTKRENYRKLLDALIGA